jgi:hypothetical protein
MATVFKSMKVPLILFVAYWTLVVGFVVATYSAYPPDPDLRDTASYGHTAPGELRVDLIVMALEIAVFAALLRPWSYARSWGRALVSLGVLTPWLVFLLAVGIHAGPPIRVHTDLLLLLWIGLLVAAISGGVAALRAWVTAKRQAAP